MKSLGNLQTFNCSRTLTRSPAHLPSIQCGEADPCFAGAECTDLPEGYECGVCPAGYSGGRMRGHDLIDARTIIHVSKK